jgi:hypothetical protein
VRSAADAVTARASAPAANAMIVGFICSSRLLPANRSLHSETTTAMLQDCGGNEKAVLHEPSTFKSFHPGEGA